MLPSRRASWAAEPLIHDVVGRRAEIASTVRWFGDRSAPSCLILEGEAGLGKSTVWSASLGAIGDAGHRVLASAPAEAESRLSYAGLADLVADDLPALRTVLPGPQARALAVAVRLEEPGSRPPDETAVARGWLEAQLALARQFGALLVAIDDVRWLDPASLAVVAYSLRRLRRDDGVKVLLTHRTGALAPAGLPIEDLGERLRLGPLSLGGIHRVIRTQTGVSLTRPRLLGLYAESAGNPLHAIELARASSASSAAPRASIVDLFAARLAGLPPETRRLLVLIAASPDRTQSRLERAWGQPVDSALHPAMAAGLVALAGSQVRPSHPLVTHIAYAEATDAGRRDAHRLLADSAATTEERALHLARSVIGPDAAAATIVEEAALEARARGVRASSATLAESAARLTPPGDVVDRARRLLAAAASWFEAGDSERVEAIVRPLLDELGVGEQRGEAAWRLGVVLDEGGRWQEAVTLWREALAGADDPGLRSRIQCSLAITAFYTESVDTAATWAEAAVASAEQSGDQRWLAEALAARALTMAMGGDHRAVEVIERALAIESTLPDVLGEWSPTAVAAEIARHGGDDEAARRHYATILDRAVRIGDANIEQWAAFGLCSSELLAGKYRRALELADTVLELADQTGVMRIPARSLRAHVDAYLGDLDGARRLVGEACEAAVAADEKTHLFGAHVVRGVIEAAAGDHAAAARAYADARALASELGLVHASALRALLNGAEEAAAAGQLVEADRFLDAFDRAVAGAVPAWARPVQDRARAAVLATRGDLAGARAILEAAVGDDRVLPFDRGRSLLALGIACRRLHQLGRARHALAEAVEAFVGLGTPPWIERARSELARVPGRRSGDRLELTAAEARIAGLVAAGRSNREVAAELFLSVKTVEVTLTRVYAKAGVRSRSELAAVYRGPRSPGATP